MDARFPRIRLYTVGLATLAMIGLGAALTIETRPTPSATWQPRPLPVPAAPGSGTYSLTEAGGQAHLSWIEAEGTGHVLKFSSLGEDGWTPARTVARGDNWFINWADRPSVAALPDGGLVAHWLVNGPGKAQSDYTYGIEVAYSSDQGQSWRAVHRPGQENEEQNQYTGFLSFLGESDALRAAYLSPPAPEDAAPTDHETHRMTLRLASFEPDGILRSDSLLDADVCSCCPLNMAETDAGAVVVYRDRWPGEVRDISIVRNVDGRWTEPKAVHRGGWEFAGCPTNGPDIAAAGQRVAVTWFTGAGDSPEVRLAFSDDAGASFRAPVRVDEGQPIGYPAVVLLEDGGAVVSWLGYGTGDRARVQLRRVSPDGELGEVVVFAETSASRSAGMPQLARTEDELVLVWRSGERIRSARVRLRETRNIAGTERS